LNRRPSKTRDRKAQWQTSSTPPSAADIAFPVVLYTLPSGSVVEWLRPYWQERPQLAPPTAGMTRVTLAHWKDGTIGAVPLGSSLALMAELYTANRVVALMREGE
jgi:hypothetical protein